MAGGASAAWLAVSLRVALVATRTTLKVASNSFTLVCTFPPLHLRYRARGVLKQCSVVAHFLIGTDRSSLSL